MLIILHEAGHFTAAKLLGVRVEKFSLFMPPTVFSRKHGETEYAIGILPLGGYVKLTGMTEEELEKVPDDIKPRSYAMQPPWKRIIIILAGPFINILIAFLVFWVILVSGSTQGVTALQNGNPNIPVLKPSTSVYAVENGEPAQTFLKTGDKIIAIDKTSVTNANQVQDLLAAHPCTGNPVNNCKSATPVTITVLRDNRKVTASLYPVYNTSLGRMILGFDFNDTPISRNIFQNSVIVFRELWGITYNSFKGLGQAVVSSKDRKNVSSIIGITEVTHQAVSRGLSLGLTVIALVSFLLAIINLLPFLPLDGGYAAWAAAEAVVKRRISTVAIWRYSLIGIFLVLFLVINGFANDLHVS